MRTALTAAAGHHWTGDPWPSRKLHRSSSARKLEGRDGGGKGGCRRADGKVRTRTGAARATGRRTSRFLPHGGARRSRRERYRQGTSTSAHTSRHGFDRFLARERHSPLDIHRLHRPGSACSAPTDRPGGQACPPLATGCSDQGLALSTEKQHRKLAWTRNTASVVSLLRPITCRPTAPDSANHRRSYTAKGCAGSMHRARAQNSRHARESARGLSRILHNNTPMPCRMRFQVPEPLGRDSFCSSTSLARSVGPRPSWPHPPLDGRDTLTASASGPRPAGPRPSHHFASPPT